MVYAPSLYTLFPLFRISFPIPPTSPLFLFQPTGPPFKVITETLQIYNPKEVLSVNYSKLVEDNWRLFICIGGNIYISLLPSLVVQEFFAFIKMFVILRDIHYPQCVK